VKQKLWLWKSSTVFERTEKVGEKAEGGGGRVDGIAKKMVVEEKEEIPLDKLLTEGTVIESFLNETANQMTYFGLLSLYEKVRDRELSVFFRNNHFCTLFRKDHRLYLLCTDAGFRDEPNAIWELLDEIDGNTNYVDANFREQSSSHPTLAYSSTPHQLSLPYEMEGQMDPQLLETIRREEEYYKQQNSSGSAVGNGGVMESDEELARRLQAEDYADGAVSHRQRRDRAMPPPRNGVNQMWIMIPQGAVPGSKLLVTNLEGAQMEVIVPRDRYPGEEILVEYTARRKPKRDSTCTIC